MHSNKFNKKLQLCTCRKCRRHTCVDHRGRTRPGCYLLPRTAQRHNEEESSNNHGNTPNLSIYEASVLFTGVSGPASPLPADSEVESTHDIDMEGGSDVEGDTGLPASGRLDSDGDEGDLRNPSPTIEVNMDEDQESLRSSDLFVSLWFHKPRSSGHRSLLTLSR